MIVWKNEEDNINQCILDDKFPKASTICSTVLTNKIVSRKKYANHQVGNLALKEYIRNNIFLEVIETMEQLSTYTVVKAIDKITLANNFCVSVPEVNHYIQYCLELFMDKGYVITIEELDKGLILLTMYCKSMKIYEPIEIYTESKKSNQKLKKLLDNE